ncbi:MAG: type I-B CRISPR-associated protein Cas5b [Candidatus Alkaliphilus sp. MAG34]
MKTLIFTAKSDYARFRCPYTTTSALTFLTIHPVAARGLIGAVLGIEYEQLYDYTKDIKIGIQVLNSIYKDTQSFNLTAQANNNKAANFQSRVQFLRDVRYRIFVNSTEEKLIQLKNTLESRSYVFTSYLGCSEHIAKLEYEDMLETTLSKDSIVDTIIDKDNVDLEAIENTTIFMDRIPVENSSTREYTKYSDIIISINMPIPIKDGEIFRVGDYNVFFL